MKQIRKRLTYANVMSSIAVFLVLGGATAIAAQQKIGTKQLKANSVTTGEDQEERGDHGEDQEQRRDRREKSTSRRSARCRWRQRDDGASLAGQLHVYVKL